MREDRVSVRIVANTSDLEKALERIIDAIGPLPEVDPSEDIHTGTGDPTNTEEPT